MTAGEDEKCFLCCKRKEIISRSTHREALCSILSRDDNHFCIVTQKEGLAPRWCCPLRIKWQTDLLLPWRVAGFYPESFLLLYTFQLAKSLLSGFAFFHIFLFSSFHVGFCLLQCYSVLLQRLTDFCVQLLQYSHNFEWE